MKCEDNLGAIEKIGWEKQGVKCEDELGVIEKTRWDKQGVKCEDELGAIEKIGWDKQGVKCEDELGAIEKTRWGKVDAMEIIECGGGNVSWQSIQFITISIFSSDICRHFDDGEIAGLAMPIQTNECNPKP